MMNKKKTIKEASPKKTKPPYKRKKQSNKNEYLNRFLNGTEFGLNIQYLRPVN